LIDQTIQKSAVKVVAHLRGGKLVKGFFNSAYGEDLDAFFRHKAETLDSEIPIHSQESDKLIKISTDSLKALFFVKSFKGSTEYSEVKFFHSNPTVEGLWIQIKFVDGEVTEGVLHNSVRYILDQGFFLKPPDPLSNNQLVYVLKKSLQDFRVLGVRSTY